MKTTIDIPESLLAEARRAALRDGTTLHELVERGLRQVLQSRRSADPFKLRKASFRGEGLQAPLRGAAWDKWREMAYAGIAERNAAGRIAAALEPVARTASSRAHRGPDGA